MELPPSLSPLPSKSWYSDNAGVEEVIGAGTVGVVKVLEDMSVKSCFNLVLDIIHQDTLVVSVPKSMVEVLAFSLPKRGKQAWQARRQVRDRNP